MLFAKAVFISSWVTCLTSIFCTYTAMYELMLSLPATYADILAVPSLIPVTDPLLSTAAI